MTDRFAALALPIDEPGRMTIMHPYTGQPLRDAEKRGAYIDLLSNDSTKAQAFERQRSARIIAERPNRANMTSEERAAFIVDDRDAERIERWAALTVGWRLLAPMPGAHWKSVKPEELVEVDVPVSEDAARELYAKPEMVWLKDQLIAWHDNRANFTGTSSTR